MGKYEGTTSQLELSRRDFLKGASAVGVTAAAMGTSIGASAANATVSGYGVTTAQLKDWSIMSKSLGVDMQFTPTNNDVGVFMRDVMESSLGDKVDIFIFEAGTQDILGPQGLYLVIDEKNPELKLWERTEEEWKRSEVVVGKDGKQYGTPVIGNADSFGYFPQKIGAAPDGQADISWNMLFESDVTRGRAAYDQTWTYSMPEAALFLQQTGKAKIANRRHDKGRGEGRRRLSRRAQEGRAVPHIAQGLRGAGAAAREQGSRHHQLLGTGDARSEQAAWCRHGLLRLYERRLLQVGPWGVHRGAGGEARQFGHHLQGSELLPRW
jgi:hypothetical protein